MSISIMSNYRSYPCISTSDFFIVWSSLVSLMHYSSKDVLFIKIPSSSICLIKLAIFNCPIVKPLSFGAALGFISIDMGVLIK